MSPSLMMLIVVSLLAYTGVITWIYTHLHEAEGEGKPESSLNTAEPVGLSLLIAAHNCPPQLPGLLEQLASQLGPDDELLLMWDGPLDQLGMIEGLLPDDRRIRVYKHPGPKGKKHALAEGLKLARHSWIVQTDADCLVPDEWLAYLRREMATHAQAGALLLPVGLTPRGASAPWLARWQATEFASVMAMTWLTARLGEPTMANGAAIAYRREHAMAFQKSRTDLDLASGDDQFFLHDLKAQGVPVVFLPHQNLEVNTGAAPSLGTLLVQRVRWAGKWRRYADRPTQALAIAVWVVHLALLFMLGAVLIFAEYPLLSLWVVKAMAEARLLARWEHQMGRTLDVPAFLLLQTTYSLYVVLIGAWATLSPAHSTPWTKQQA